MFTADATIPEPLNAVLKSDTTLDNVVLESVTVALSPVPALVTLIACPPVNVGVPVVPVTDGQLVFQSAEPTCTHVPELFLYQSRITVETAVIA